MCGICGEFAFRGEQASADTVAMMLPSLVRRGPDAKGLEVMQPVVFGHRRLSVIDLSENSSQPMFDKQSGLMLVFNGAIYNYKILRKQLQDKGHEFHSEGDTEVILKAWQEWGEECVSHLIGMFAFAIWDAKQQQLFLARDRLGIKPLYYSMTDKHIRFASNPQALLGAGGVDCTIDSVALHHQFTLHAVVPAPRTLLRGVRKLQPAMYMLINKDGLPQTKRYWQLNATRPKQKMTDDEWIDAIKQSLMNSVRRRLDIADVPVGVLLSGGLDSSLLVGLLAESGIKDLRTFSVGFEDAEHEKGNEFEYSDQVVERFETDHRKFLIANSEVLKRLPEAVENMAEPMFGQDAVAFYLLSEQVSKEIKVVQSGQGADEVFAGYFWYPQMHEASGSVVSRFADHYFDRDHDEYLEMVQSKYQGEDYTSELVLQQLIAPDADEYLDQVLRFDVTTLVVDDPVKRVDNMTMAWGLEARVPFLDHELVELAAQMPVSLKLRDHGKYALKQISRGLLPDSVIDRPKGYFPMPALKYVKGDFLDFMRDILTSRQCIERGLYQRQYVDKLLANPESHFTRLQGSKLWHLALLEYWLQLNL
jgi:asparagine synthase (glutamine-hydrolysing)